MTEPIPGSPFDDELPTEVPTGDPDGVPDSPFEDDPTVIDEPVEE